MTEHSALTGGCIKRKIECENEKAEAKRKPDRIRAYVVQWDNGDAIFYDKDPGTVIGNLHLRKGAFCKPVWKGWMVSEEGEDV